MSLRSETGVTLILVLILLTAISFISAHLLLQSILNGKMVKHFQQQLQDELLSENQLVILENSLLSNPLSDLSKQTKRIYFVPDHLAFGCLAGVWIFKNTSKLAESFVALPDPSLQPLFSFNPTAHQANNADRVAFFSQNVANPYNLLNVENFAQNIKLMDIKLLDMLFVGPAMQKWDQLPGYTDFKHQNRTRTFQLFALANAGESNHQKGLLYQIDCKTGKMLQTFQLPFSIKGGYLVASDVFYANAWRTFLAVSITEKEGLESALFIFDITAPESLLKACVVMDNTTTSNLASHLSRASFLRFKNGEYGVGVGGLLKNQGVLQIYSLQTKVLPIQVEFGILPICYLQAIDLDTKAWVDRIYCSDKLHWWAIDLSNLNKPFSQQLASLSEIFLETPMSLIVTKSPYSTKHQSNRLGVNLYFLGKDKKGEGLFRIHDPLKTEGPSSMLSAFDPNPIEGGNTLEYISPGKFHSLYTRFGRLLLVPRQASVPPSIINLANHQAIKNQWFSEVFNSEDEICASMFVWDPKQKKDILFTINTHKINQFKIQLNSDKYGRLAWRSLILD